MPQTVPFGGKMFRRGNSYIILPSMSLGDAEALEADLEKCSDKAIPWKYRRDLMLTAIHAAAALNYPKITLAEVKAFFTFKNVFEAYAIATGTSSEDEVYEALGEFLPAGERSPGATSAGA